MPDDDAPVTKQCCVIAPIGGPNSTERRATDGLLASAIRPALKTFGLEVTAAHEIDESGNIPQQVIMHLVEDDLVIADLTGLNPNVMFELAIRYSAAKPVILLALADTRLPFDFNQERTIFYVNDMAGSEVLKHDLHRMVETALADTQPDNPVYRAINERLIREHAPKGDLESLVLDRMDRIDRSLRQLRSNQPNFPHPPVSVGMAYDVTFDSNEALRDFLGQFQIMSLDHRPMPELLTKGDKVVVRLAYPDNISVKDWMTITEFPGVRALEAAN